MMKSTRQTPGQDSKSARPRRVALVTAACTVGSMIAWYSWTLYGESSALVIARTFFPPGPGRKTVAQWLFEAGFLARPLGGVLFGHVGDTISREVAMVAGLCVMCLATALIGVVPSYHHWGDTAWKFLLVLRVLQGFGFGGAWTGLVITPHELLGGEKRRGLFTAIPQAGFGLGLILSCWVMMATSTVRDANTRRREWRRAQLATAAGAIGCAALLWSILVWPWIRYYYRGHRRARPPPTATNTDTPDTAAGTRSSCRNTGGSVSGLVLSRLAVTALRPSTSTITTTTTSTLTSPAVISVDAPATINIHVNTPAAPPVLNIPDARHNHAAHYHMSSSEPSTSTSDITPTRPQGTHSSSHEVLPGYTHTTIRSSSNHQLFGKKRVRVPILAVLIQHFRNILVGACVLGIDGIIQVVMVAWGIPTLVNDVGVAPPEVFTYYMCNGALCAVCTVLGGYLSDVFGRRKVFCCCSLLLSVSAPLYIYSILRNGFTESESLGYFIFGLLQGVMKGAIPGLISDLFPPEVRFSGLALIHDVSRIPAAAYFPRIADTLMRRGKGQPVYLCLYVFGAGVLAAFAVFQFQLYVPVHSSLRVRSCVEVTSKLELSLRVVEVDPDGDDERSEDGHAGDFKRGQEAQDVQRVHSVYAMESVFTRGGERR